MESVFPGSISGIVAFFYKAIFFCDKTDDQVIKKGFGEEKCRRKVKPLKVKSPVVESPVVKSTSVESPVVKSTSVESKSVESPIVESKNVESPIVESTSVESKSVESTSEQSPKVAAQDAETCASLMERPQSQIKQDKPIAPAPIDDQAIEGPTNDILTAKEPSQIVELKPEVAPPQVQNKAAVEPTQTEVIQGNINPEGPTLPAPIDVQSGGEEPTKDVATAVDPTPSDVKQSRINNDLTAPDVQSAETSTARDPTALEVKKVSDIQESASKQNVPDVDLKKELRQQMSAVSEVTQPTKGTPSESKDVSQSPSDAKVITSPLQISKEFDVEKKAHKHKRKKDKKKRKRSKEAPIETKNIGHTPNKSPLIEKVISQPTQSVDDLIIKKKDHKISKLENDLIIKKKDHKTSKLENDEEKRTRSEGTPSDLTLTGGSQPGQKEIKLEKTDKSSGPDGKEIKRKKAHKPSKGKDGEKKKHDKQSKKKHDKQSKKKHDKKSKKKHDKQSNKKHDKEPKKKHDKQSKKKHDKQSKKKSKPSSAGSGAKSKE